MVKMVFYFSATGNSQYAAEKIAGAIGERIISIGPALKDKQLKYDITDDDYLIFVVPAFAWTLPGAVAEFIKNMTLTGYKNQAVYGVFTCGESSGAETAALSTMLKAINIDFKGSFDLVMPDNFILWSDIPSKQKLDAILASADKSLEKIIGAIREKAEGKIDNSIPRELFMPMNTISTSGGTSKFYASEDCVSCGLCETVCPVSCIKMDGRNRPVWEGLCTMCLACLHNCPNSAIEHGSDTKGKGRYINPNTSLRLKNTY